ncbi:MAG: protein kinase [Methanoregula sp.]|nr:MAG: protein kinase [Methanoregula sp.]
MSHSEQVIGIKNPLPVSAACALAIVLIMLLVHTTAAAEFTVLPSGGDFTGIQAAVSHASAGDTILVGSGTYNEKIRVDKTLTVRGIDTGGGAPVIDPEKRGNAVEITANGCTFSGFVVQNAELLSGIRISSDRTTLTGNTVKSCGQGIFLDSADKSVITGNNITRNVRTGIALEGSTGNRIEANSITKNTVGIVLDESSSSNRIFLNTFDNTANVISKSITSVWDTDTAFTYRYLGRDVKSPMGNYWGDYSGKDANGDGIGDTPYNILVGANKKLVAASNQNVVDRYPLMDPVEFYPGAREAAAITPARVVFGTLPVTVRPAATALPSQAATGASIEPASAQRAGLLRSILGSAPWTAALLVFVAVLCIGGGVIFLLYRRDRATLPEPLPERASVPGVHPVATQSEKARAASVTVVTDQTDVQEPAVRPAADQKYYFPRELEGKYSDIRSIGRGGIARVFAATRTSDGHRVAVKIPISFDEVTGKSFLNEIKVWEMLRHPNIVEVSAVNILPLPYVEMEYVEGSLEMIAKPVPVWKAVYIVRKIADALRYAHGLGIIHRDIKPHNILVTADLTPKITDWGMSKVLATDMRKSSIAGFSLAYAAPEQVSPAEFGRTDERTDIYQLGVVFYELVTGSIPFGGESMVEVGTAILRDPPVLPSEFNPGAAAVDKIILKCLQKDPGQRYQSAQELLDALSGYLDEE